MWITNAHLIGTDAALAVPQTSQVHLRFDEQYRLAEISAKMPQHGPVPRIDFQGDFVSLGGVDLQINGALGLAFPDLSEAHGAMLEKIGAFLWTQGIDAYAPTLVTTASSKVQTALAVLAAYRPRQSLPQAAILGAHLEGPCLNPAKRGAHPESFLQPLTQPVLQDLLGEFGNQVCIVTLAPELDPTGTTIAYLRSQQIVVSLGHSLATDLEAEQAFAQGATMVTHACNAMPPLHHREPGLLAT
ncbi:N-acetylglucosamine-6-phosphate deacetylase, partial [Lyngbya confervoides BDU141951]|nr:N-acetylglucosamine-6-phosphate deacetylase [Lyngbya confervoides BDU141951]